MTTYAQSVAWSPNFTTSNGRAVVRAASSIHYLVVHTMEAPEKVDTAENIAIGWFGKSVAQASSHWCFDNNSRVRCVRDENIAWAAPGANATGIQYELAGYAGQSSTEWHDAYSQALLDNVAQQAAIDAKKYGIPVVHLSVSDILAGKKGFIGHIDATNAFRGGRGHTDPGKNFPWDEFLAKVRQYMGGAAITTPTPIASTKAALSMGSTGVRVKALQKTFNDKWLRPHNWRLLVEDGIYGPECVRVVKAYQGAVHIAVDGIAGKDTLGAIRQQWKVDI